MTHKKATTEVQELIGNYDTDRIVEVVFSWLIDGKIPVAVKSHCLNILANLIPKHPNPNIKTKYRFPLIPLYLSYR